MTNEEAIKLIEEFMVIDDWSLVYLPDLHDALDVAIKALKRELQNSHILDEEASNALMDIILKEDTKQASIPYSIKKSKDEKTCLNCGTSECELGNRARWGFCGNWTMREGNEK